MFHNCFLFFFFFISLSTVGINVSGPDIIASIFVSSWVKTLCEGENAILDEESALPTILFLMTMSTFIMGVIWFAIGHYHMTKVVEYLPAPLVCGFLSCIGWKVVKYATKVSSGSSWYAADDGYFWVSIQSDAVSKCSCNSR